jgi:hypothetical protein
VIVNRSAVEPGNRQERRVQQPQKRKAGRNFVDVTAVVVAAAAAAVDTHHHQVYKRQR